MTSSTISRLETCPEHLSDEQIAQYHRDGWLAFSDVLTPDEVQSSRQGLSQLVTQLAHDVPARKSRPQHQPFIQFESGYTPSENESMQHIELKVRKLMWFQNLLPIFNRLASAHSRIGGVVQSILGKDAILFQDMALIKPPLIGSEKPWHQDVAYFAYVPIGRIIGCWIALDDAAVENGCMHVLPGGHRVGPRKHHHTSDCEIESNRLNPADAVPVEIPTGGAMFFNGLLPHQTPPNTSPHRRRALQFHYRGADTRYVENEEFDRAFAEHDGTPASCRAAAESQNKNR